MPPSSYSLGARESEPVPCESHAWSPPRPGGRMANTPSSPCARPARDRLPAAFACAILAAYKCATHGVDGTPVVPQTGKESALLVQRMARSKPGAPPGAARSAGGKEERTHA